MTRFAHKSFISGTIKTVKPALAEAQEALASQEGAYLQAQARVVTYESSMASLQGLGDEAPEALVTQMSAELESARTGLTNAEPAYNEAKARSIVYQNVLNAFSALTNKDADYATIAAVAEGYLTRRTPLTASA